MGPINGCYTHQHDTKSTSRLFFPFAITRLHWARIQALVVLRERVKDWALCINAVASMLVIDPSRKATESSPSSNLKLLKWVIPGIYVDRDGLARQRNLRGLRDSTQA